MTPFVENDESSYPIYGLQLVVWFGA
jgi:hypothetical protein